MKVAGWDTDDTSYAGEFMGMVPDNRASGVPITRVHKQHYSSTVVPFWSVDENSLSKNKISIDWDDVSDNNAFFTTHYDVLKAFKNAGENSGLSRKYYQTLDDYGGSGLIKWSPREQYEFFKKHKILNAISGFPVQGYENYKKAMDKLNQRNNIDTSAYDKDFADRYGKAITPERYNELQRLHGTPEYKKKLKEYVAPWARDYSKKTVKEKTAALAEELTPAPSHRNYKQDIITAFFLNGENSGLPTSPKEIPGLKPLPAPRDNTKFNTTLAATGLGTALAGYAAQSFRIPNKAKNVAGIASLAGIATGLGGLAKERIDKHNNIMDRAKTVGHNRNLLKSWLDARKRYSDDLNSRYNNVATPEFLRTLNEKEGTPEYTRLISTTVKPYVRDYSKQKTAALAEELNPVPKPKRDRSAFQRFVDTLSTNKAKHVAGVAGGISGMLAGRELLHSTMPEIGAIGIIGGATLGAKNIYGLYKDYFD